MAAYTRRTTDQDGWHGLRVSSRVGAVLRSSNDPDELSISDSSVDGSTTSLRYNTIRKNDFTCSQKLMGSQLNRSRGPRQSRNLAIANRLRSPSYILGAVVQLVECRTRNQEVVGSTHTRCTASNLEQVANLLCAQANSASYPQRGGK